MVRKWSSGLAQLQLCMTSCRQHGFYKQKDVVVYFVVGWSMCFWKGVRCGYIYRRRCVVLACFLMISILGSLLGERLSQETAGPVNEPQEAGWSSLYPQAWFQEPAFRSLDPEGCVQEPGSRSPWLGSRSRHPGAWSLRPRSRAHDHRCNRDTPSEQFQTMCGDSRAIGKFHGRTNAV